MTQKSCPSCGSNDMSIFYKVQHVPVNSCVLLPTQKQAINFPRGDVILGFCRNCGFISNTAFDTSKVNYSSVYEDQQCYSPTFNIFAKNLVTRLIEKYNLHNKQILEIGCGKGDFLALLCELGGNSGVGIDPAYVDNRIESAASGRLVFVRDYYSECYNKYIGDFICCRHTLEHIYETAEFMNCLRRAIGDRLDASVFFEVPDVVRVLNETAFWDIYYEHCSYFSLGSLSRLFRFCNFNVTALSRDFADQYLLIEGKPALDSPRTKLEEEESVEEMSQTVDYFSKRCCEKIDQWKTRLKRIKEEKKSAVIWGSGSKCVAFMTTLGIRDEIDHVIDINPHRHGKYIPGAGKKIMSPSFLKEFQPDFTFVMNPAYCREIEQLLNEIGVKTEIIPV
jgi:SAM-dependent methyltransferase